jgi:hypothetical protein
MKGGEEYLAMYPFMERWMNRCIACQRLGYKPEMPDLVRSWPSAHADYIRSYFSPLEVDADGFCEQCHNAKNYGKTEDDL